MTAPGTGAKTSVRVLVSIVTYNSAEVIADCLRNLAWMRDASGLDAEIIVADNASTDRTLEILRPFADESYVTVVPSPRNVGWGAGNNLAIASRAADPDYVLLCNPDASIDEEHFRALLAGLQEHEPKAAIAVPQLEGATDTVLGANPEWRLSRYFLRDYWGDKYAFRRFQARYADAARTVEIRHGYASGALALVSFPVLAEVGFFDERLFMFNDDVDLTRRILQRGHTLIGVPSAVGHHFGGQGSHLDGEDVPASTAILRLMAESDLVFIEKWYGPRWARAVAAYRWYAFYRVSNALRRAARRTLLDAQALRAPAGEYLHAAPADKHKR